MTIENFIVSIKYDMVGLNQIKCNYSQSLIIIKLFNEMQEEIMNVFMGLISHLLRSNLKGQLLFFCQLLSKTFTT